MAAPGNGTLAGHELACSVRITDGAWHRVGLVWDGADRVLCVDDVEVARGALTGRPAWATGPYIGTGPKREAGAFWPGLIDDVRIYNRAVKP